MTNNITHAPSSARTPPRGAAEKMTGNTVTLDVSNGLELRVHFTMPVQPPSYDRIDIGPLTFGRGVESYIRSAAIYVSGVEIGRNLAENFISARFADAGSRFAGDRITGVIDFNTIANGVDDGLIIIRVVCGAGYATFNTDDIRMSSGGDGVKVPGCDPVITAVTVAPIAPLPLPATSTKHLGI